jgi:hypothetical protein
MTDYSCRENLLGFVKSLPIADEAKDRIAAQVLELVVHTQEVLEIQAQEDLSWLVRHARFDTHVEDQYAEAILERWGVET